MWVCGWVRRSRQRGEREGGFQDVRKENDKCLCVCVCACACVQDTKALQTSEMNDPDYGYASPYEVFNRDQVPICLASSWAKTVDNMGAEVIWDSTHNPRSFLCNI